MSNRYYNLGDDKQGRYDNLSGDEPEYERMASMAEAGRDVDAEIDRKIERMDAEDAKRNRHNALLMELRFKATTLIGEIGYLVRMSDVPNGINSWTADNVAKQAERLQALCREMAK